MKKKYQNFDIFSKITDFEKINTRTKVNKMLMENQGKLEKSQGKVNERSVNSMPKIWQTPCTMQSGYRVVYVMISIVS